MANFRTHYYKKVGVTTKDIENKQAFELLLSDDETDKGKLYKAVLHTQIPPSSRKIVWQMLLGILPYQKQIHSYTHILRTEQYDDITKSLVTRGFNLDNFTIHQQLLIVLRLENHVYPYDNKKVTQKEDKFIKLSKSILSMFPNHIDAYWITKHLFEIITDMKFTNAIELLVSMFKYLLHEEDYSLYKKFQSNQLFDKMPLASWFSTIYAGIIPDYHLVRSIKIKAKLG